MCPLEGIRLVDTQSVRPYEDRAVWSSKPPEDREEVLGDRYSFAIAAYEDLLDRADVSPCVGDSCVAMLRVSYRDFLKVGSDVVAPWSRLQLEETDSMRLGRQW